MQAIYLCQLLRVKCLLPLCVCLCSRSFVCLPACLPTTLCHPAYLSVCLSSPLPARLFPGLFTGRPNLFVSVSPFRFGSVQSLGRLGRRGDTRDDSAESIFHSFLREVFKICSDMKRNVYSLTLSIQHFLCRPRRRPSPRLPCF